MSNFEKVAQQFRQNVEEWYRNVVAPASDGGEQISRAEFKVLGDRIKDAIPYEARIESWGDAVPGIEKVDYYSTVNNSKLSRRDVMEAVLAHAYFICPELNITENAVREMGVQLFTERFPSGEAMENRYVLSAGLGIEIHVIHEQSKPTDVTFLKLEAYEDGKYRRISKSEPLYAAIIEKVRARYGEFISGGSIFPIGKDVRLFADYGNNPHSRVDPSHVDELWLPEEKPQLLTIAEYGVEHFADLLRQYAGALCPEDVYAYVSEWKVQEISDELAQAAKTKGLTPEQLATQMAAAVDKVAQLTFEKARREIKTYSSLAMVDRGLKFLENLSTLMLPNAERPEDLKMPDRQVLLLEVYNHELLKMRENMSPHPFDLMDTANQLAEIAVALGISVNEVHAVAVDKYFEALHSMFEEHPGPSSADDPSFQKMGRVVIRLLDKFLQLSQRAFASRQINLRNGDGSYYVSQTIQLCVERIRAYRGQKDDPLVQDYIQVHLKYLKWLSPTHPLFDELPQ